MTSLLTASGGQRGAHISKCGRYRYQLWRRWGAGPSVLWVMFNPSTADGLHDDPTIRRCIGFTKAWGFGGLRVVNLVARRATRPVDACSAEADAINEGVLREELAAAHNARRIAAWGALVEQSAEGARLATLAATHHLECLGTTVAGHPRHPLYVPATVQPVPYALDAVTGVTAR